MVLQAFRLRCLKSQVLATGCLYLGKVADCAVLIKDDCCTDNSAIGGVAATSMPPATTVTRFNGGLNRRNDWDECYDAADRTEYEENCMDIDDDDYEENEDEESNWDYSVDPRYGGGGWLVEAPGTLDPFTA